MVLHALCVQALTLGSQICVCPLSGNLLGNLVVVPLESTNRTHSPMHVHVSNVNTRGLCPNNSGDPTEHTGLFQGDVDYSMPAVCLIRIQLQEPAQSSSEQYQTHSHS